MPGGTCFVGFVDHLSFDQMDIVVPWDICPDEIQPGRLVSAEQVSIGDLCVHYIFTAIIPDDVQVIQNGVALCLRGFLGHTQTSRFMGY